MMMMMIVIITGDVQLETVTQIVQHNTTILCWNHHQQQDQIWVSPFLPRKRPTSHKKGCF
jgi:hypothetical protein